MTLPHRRRRANRLLCATLLAAAATLVTSPVAAQDVIETTRMELWCGIALSLLAESVPGDATDEQKALAARFAEGGTVLTDRARALLLESGFTDEQLAARIDTLRAEADAAVNRGEAEPAYSFEACQALLPA